MPKDASNAKSAKRTARILPRVLNLNPLSRAYIAPPSILPSEVFTRYFTPMSDSEYFVAIPKTPVSQHQRTAPGPPSAIAVPTPMILPVPIVEASAVARA